jgi:putative hydrolase of the HAD superfamily
LKKLKKGFGGYKMPRYKCILFDCMETIIDVIEKPDLRLYAYWAYAGCGYESLWESFDAFAQSYSNIRNAFKKSYKEFEEYNLLDIFEYMAKQLSDDANVKEKVTKALFNNYWRNYKSNCIVYDDVKSVLSELSDKYKLGIVSNFIVKEGVEELLKINGIYKYFDFVVTSIKIGWRKPHHIIYDTALDLAKVSKEEILFTGDDYVCDYEGPTKYGIDAVLLDKECIYGNVEKRIITLDQIVDYFD